MTNPLPLEKARDYADRLLSATSYSEIDTICSEIKEVEGMTRYKDGKQWGQRVKAIKEIIEALPLEKLIIGKNAFVQIKQNGDQWLRHYFIKSIGIADTNWTPINQKAKDKNIEALTEKKEILVSKYLETACKLLQSNNPHELAVGLIAVSGRRPIEILSLAEFNKKKSFKDMPAGVLDKAKDLNIDYYVNFSGQAKRGDNTLEEGEKLKYPIGLLVPVDAFLSAFNRLRALPECLEISKIVYSELDKGNSRENINTIIENHRGNSLRRIVQRCFDFVPPKLDEKNITNRALRACYVRLITDRDCPKTIDDLLWASRSVGHFIDVESPDKNKLMDLITTLNYRYYYTNENTPFVNLQVVATEPFKAIHGYASDVDKLNELVNKYGFDNQKHGFRYVLDKAEKALELESKIEKLQLRIKELEAMKSQEIEVKEVIKEVPVEVIKEVPVEIIKEVAMPLTINSELQELIKNEVALQVKKALEEEAKGIKLTKIEDAKTVNKPAKTDDTDWEGMSHEQLWQTKKQGASSEKIRRSFLAVGYYNGEVADGDTLPKIAVTNQVLRDLSRCNGQLVGDWMRDHEDEIISHNENFGMFTKTGQLESYANRQLGLLKVKQTLEVVNEKFLDGQALNKKVNEEQDPAAE
jgi:hypothetical protein